MKAIRIHEHGGPEVMKLEEVALADLSAGMVRVKIAAAGLNFIDIYQRSGAYKIALPYILGMEGAGSVEAVADDITDFKVGDRVAYGFTAGSYAQYANVPANKLVPIPDAVSFKQGAALMLQGMTAHYLITDTFAVKPGHTILIHAAAGATGQLVVQMAKLRGARVIATASSEDKLNIARTVGADDAVLYDTFDSDVNRLTDGRGVDVVYDSVGKDTFERSLNCLRPRGMLALFGQASGAVPPFDPQILNTKGSLFFTRPSLGPYIATKAEMLSRTNEIFEWVSAGKLSARIDRELPLVEAPAAHVALNSRGTTGKVLLIP